MNRRSGPVLDPDTYPRPFVMVAALLAHETGELLTPARVGQIERDVMKRLREALKEFDPGRKE